MATKTRDQMIELTLQRLGVVAQGQAASSHDTLLAGSVFDSCYAELVEKEVFSFDSAAVPDWAWSPLRDYVASKLVGDFGISGERLMEIRQAGQEGEMRLAAANVSKQEFDIKVSYY
jgi:hypothetical protein